MAIDTENKRRSVLQCIPGLNTYPVADGAINSSDRAQVSWIYSGLAIFVKSIGGTLITSGAVAVQLTLKRAYGGTLTTSGILAKKTSISKGGNLTLAGALNTVAIYVQSINGVLTISGSLSVGNPDWLLIPDNLNWQGVWSITTSYDNRDVVLYQDGDQIHAFVSKQSHNIGYTPTVNHEWWTRLVQTEWNK